MGLEAGEREGSVYSGCAECEYKKEREMRKKSRFVDVWCNM